MQTISSYLVKISVNIVYNCTIITWHKIVIDNCFCDGQSSKVNNSKSINDSYYSCTLHVDLCWLIIYIKFREYSLSGFQVIEWTRFL